MYITQVIQLMADSFDFKINSYSSSSISLSHVAIESWLDFLCYLHIVRELEQHLIITQCHSLSTNLLKTRYHDTSLVECSIRIQNNGNDKNTGGQTNLWQSDFTLTRNVSKYVSLRFSS